MVPKRATIGRGNTRQTDVFPPSHSCRAPTLSFHGSAHVPLKGWRMAKIDDDDIGRNTSDNETFEQVVEARLSRRGFLGGTIGTVAAASLSSVGALLQAVPASAKTRQPAVARLQRDPGRRAEDTVVLPDGYTAEVLIAWGDPVSDGPAFLQNAGNSAADQARQWGMHNDGVVYFPINGSAHGLLVQNNEYTDDVLLFPDGTANWARRRRRSRSPRTAFRDRVANVAAAAAATRAPSRRWGHKGGEWRVVRPSQYARRVTGHDADRDRRAGAAIRACRPAPIPPGDWCSARSTTARWGSRPGAPIWPARRTSTSYFRKTGRRPSSNAATGSRRRRRYLWHTTDSRFNANLEPNEAQPIRLGRRDRSVRAGRPRPSSAPRWGA